MREREILAIAKGLGIYDKKMDFVEISPAELVLFAEHIQTMVIKEVIYKLEKL